MSVIQFQIVNVWRIVQKRSADLPPDFLEQRLGKKQVASEGNGRLAVPHACARRPGNRKSGEIILSCGNKVP